MATRSANLPIETKYLARAWFVLAAILLAAVTVAIMALAARSTPAGGTRLGPVRDYGPAQGQGAPIVVNGSVCGQCR